MNKLVERVERLSILDVAYSGPQTVGPVSLNYTANMDSNFQDYMAYTSTMNKFLEETVSIKKLNEFVSEGTKYCSLLYSWRPITSTLPLITDDDPRRLEIYETIDKVFSMATAPIFDFYEFVTSSVSEFIGVVTHHCNVELIQEGVSDGILMALGRSLDMFSTLDDLKSAKTSATNDFSTFKRIRLITKTKVVPPESIQLFSKVAFFLAQPNEIMNSIKRELEKLPESSKLLALIVARYCEYIDKKEYISPVTHFMALRIILTSLYALSFDKTAISRLESIKVSLSRVDRIFRETPVIPLIGDMHSNVSVMLKRMNFNYDWTLLDPIMMAKSSPSFSITSYLDIFEKEHISLVSEFAQIINSPSVLGCNKGIKELSGLESTEIYRFILRTLRVIGRWNYSLQVVFFSGFCHPADPTTLKDIADKIESYSLATRYNYTSAEKSAMARVIFYIKSLSNILLKNEPFLTLSICTHMYSFLQSFANSTLLDLQKKSEKSKNQIFRRIIESLKNILADQAESVAVLRSSKKSERGAIVVKKKSIPPSSTQLYMLQTMLRVLVTQKDYKKILDSNLIQQINAFLAETAFFPEMESFSQTLEECATLHQFWFKEFYIEIAKRECIHYPIDDSFAPFIIRSLTDGNELNMYEYVLLCTSPYDDAAQYVLHVLKRRHLYDEIDAEAHLAFEQLCYFLSEKLYSIMRAEAFCNLIDKSLKNNILRRLSAVDKSLVSELTIPYQPAHQIFNLCKQRIVRYLGRSIDINALFSQRLLINLQRSIDTLVSYFEASTLESIILIKGLIELYRQTHAIICRNFNLPPFHCILAQANGDIPGYLPRLTSQIISNLISDLGPNYSYSLHTTRFVRSPVIYTDARFDPPKVPVGQLYGNKSLATAFEDYYSVYSKYVGIEHFRAIFHLIGYSGIVTIIENLKMAISSLVSGKLKDYLSVLRSGMPITCVLSRIAFTFSGFVKYLETHFKNVLKYGDLRPRVLHNLSTLGNYLIIVYLLERSVYSIESHSLYFTAPFNGVIGLKSSAQDDATKVFNHFKYCMIEQLKPLIKDERFQGMLHRAFLLNQEKLCCGLSPFSSVLQFLQKILDEPTWTGPEPQNGVISIIECVEVHRIFSLLFYYLCCPAFESDTCSDLEFGDGVLFGPLAIIICLGQHHRYEALNLISHAISLSERENVQSQSLSLSGGTMKATMKKVQKDNSKSDYNEETKKILSNMKNQASKQRVINDIIVNALSHHSSTYTQIVKCFHPPTFTPMQ